MVCQEYNHKKPHLVWFWIDINRACGGISEYAVAIYLFELLSWDEKTWTWAAPMIREFRQRLQAKFPDIDIAVVSHGAEQFQLTKNEAEKQPEAIASLRSLNEEGVNLHVCGTHSGWQNVDEEAYLDFVDVSPSGPAQINDYIKLGYTHILLRRPSTSTDTRNK